MNATSSMTTLREAHKHDACYWGHRGEWLIAAAVHRDSGTLDRANWASWVELLGGESDTVAIERSNHWAVGWVDCLVIDPADEARVKLAEETREKLENYPVLDEEALSNLEWEEYNEAWESYGATEFCEALQNKFSLFSKSEQTLLEWEGLRDWYESLISSGEYYIPESSGVSLNIRSAVFHCTRDLIAKALRNARNN